MMFSKEVLIEHHLRNNIFPPVSLELVPYAIEALGLVNDGFFHNEVTVNGSTLRNAITGESITAIEVVGTLRMQDFVESEEIV